MSERAVALGVLVGCACYLIWVALSAHSALSPALRSQGLTRVYLPPKTTEKPGEGRLILDPRPSSLSRELERRYRWPHEALDSELGPLSSAEALSAWLTERGERPELSPLREDSHLPVILWAGERGRLRPLLLIARYGGEWVRFEPSRGVLLGPLPHGSLGQPALSSASLREPRW